MDDGLWKGRGAFCLLPCESLQQVRHLVMNLHRLARLLLDLMMLLVLLIVLTQMQRQHGQLNGEPHGVFYPMQLVRCIPLPTS